MLKLALFAAVFLLLSLKGYSSQPPLPRASKDHSQNGNAQGKPVQPQTQPNLQGTQTSPLWVNVNCPGCPKPDTKENESKSKNKSANWRRDPNWWLVCLTGVLALIALGQAYLFFIQLGMLRESMEDSKTAADAAKVAAEAAMKSADIATNSERAWMITSGVAFASDWPNLTDKTAPTKSKMIIQIRNSGRSPAEMESVHVVAIVYPANFKFPDSPIYGESEEIFEIAAMPGEIIKSGGKREIVCRIRHHDVLTDEQIKDIREGRQVVYCYGRIRYKDISSSERITYFGYYYRVKTNDTDDMPEAMYRLRNRAYNYTT